MIDREELAICRRRGHRAPCLHAGGGWIPCKYCGMWLRERLLTDEREDEPPEEEIDGMVIAERMRQQRLDKGKS